jgi:hypothetical protein
MAATIAGVSRPPPAPPDVTEVLALAEAEGVSALLAHRLGEHGGLPPETTLLPRLHAVALSRAALSLRREQETVRCLRLLRESGLAFILLKGEALAHSLYERPDLRSRSDIDILVAGRDAMERAWAVFEGEGYLRKNTLQGRFTGFQVAFHRQLADGVEIQFDIHREINDFTWFARRLPFAELLENTGTVSLAGEAFRGLDHRYALLHACVHRLTNRPHGTDNRLLWLYDIHLLAQAQSAQWQAFVSLAREKQMARICLHALEAARDYFNTDVDVHALAVAAADEPVGLGAASTRWQFYVADWRHNPGWGNKLVQLREHLLPSPGYMREKYRVRHAFLLPFYYVKRILQGLFKSGS